MTVADVRETVPRAGELRRRVRSRKPRHSLTATLSLLFERALYLAVLGGLVWEVVHDGLRRIDQGDVASSSPGTSVIRLTSAIIAVLCVALLARALLAFGPLYAGAASRTWLLSTPVDRGRLLVGHFAAAVAIGTAACAAIGMAFLLTAGLAVPFAPWLVLWAAIGTIETCLCVLAQARLRSVRGVQRGLGVVSYALAIVAVAIPVLQPGYLLTGLETAGTVVYTTCAVVLVAGTAVAIHTARRGLDTLTLGAVSSGVELATATQVSVLSLDFTFFWSIVLERRARTIARVRPAAIKGSRSIALVRADLARVLRTRTGLFVWAALMPVPYAAHVIGLTLLLPAVHLVAAFLAVDRLAGGLRFVSHSPSIRRALGGSDRSLMLAHLVVPATGAVVWSSVTAALISGISVLAAAISAVGAVLVAYRIATRPPTDYGGSLVDFGVFGPTPVGLILQLARGPALLAVLCLVQTALAG
ncbi:DUF6297 family protein [Actinomadura geliboluensis]|uniref:Uncharacterized protein n=1 Tax=Actinomadura geliboluensis TaxID=882440 RepID=A0A5S4G3Z0_9ACTN|nr:DUF6297 family protein [Actinomadura geliboluensis]TMR27723.1 hypothetical protein ETD96_38870 [Actinomadura geliboluensis]CNF13655.1 Uncharacterised protein [Mycobacterium tuberculosis]